MNKTRVCHICGNSDNYYAVGLCRNHYERKRTTGRIEKLRDITLKSKCSVGGCNNLSTKRTRSGKCYCKFHYLRLSLGIPLNRPYGVRGELNPRWSGGSSEYKNHYEFKKARKIVLDRCENKCQCGAQATHVHHIDGNKTNHKIENLKAMCAKCHKNEHSGTPYLSKYRRIYGMDLEEIGALFGKSSTWAKRQHDINKLKIMLKKIDKP